MSYLVLARKYRPSDFDEVIGQDHIIDLLKKAVASDRTAHAYLFCGPRGIGKTSCARILAKSLNCEKGPTLKPCGQCSACKEIAQGNSFDVLEIDGASNRGIDEIRTLRENVKFAPSYGRYKIYVVDEVHMLTTEAFNALLKTLEEPPEHAKFIFATTDINKVPATIISRCQRFDFKRIPLETIVQMLGDICRKEKLKIEPGASSAIAKAAQGSFRDALSILDQLSAVSERSIREEDVFSMLGMVETQFLFDLSDALSKKDCARALEIFDVMIAKGKDIKQLNKDLIEHFRNFMIIKIGGKGLGKMLDCPIAVKEIYLAQSAQFTLREILRAIELFIEAADVSRITESLRIPMEIAFAKMACPPAPPVNSPAGKPQAAVKSPAPNTVVSPLAGAEPPERKFSPVSPVDVLKNQRGAVQISSEDAEKKSAPGPDAPAEAVLTDTVDLQKVKNGWDALTHAISLKKMSVATYLQEGVPSEVIDKGNFIRLVIGFSAKAAFQKECLETKENRKLIESIFSEKLCRTVSVDFVVVHNYVPQEDEPVVKAALETFNGKVVSKWHKEEGVNSE